MARKEDFRSLLFHKHEVDLAAKLARLIKREEKLYNKFYKDVKKLTYALLRGELTVTRNGKEIEIVQVLKEVKPEHDKAFRRYMETLRLAFPYCHPTMKAMEVKGDTTGKIAFSVLIPEVKTEKKKGKSSK